MLLSGSQIPKPLIRAAGTSGVGMGKVIAAIELLNPNPLWAELLQQMRLLVSNEPAHSCYKDEYEGAVQDYTSLLYSIVIKTAEKIPELPEA